MIHNMFLCLSDIEDGRLRTTKFKYRTLWNFFFFSQETTNLIESKHYMNSLLSFLLIFFVWIGNTRWPPESIAWNRTLLENESKWVFSEELQTCLNANSAPISYTMCAIRFQVGLYSSSSRQGGIIYSHKNNFMMSYSLFNISGSRIKWTVKTRDSFFIHNYFYIITLAWMI